MWKLFGGKNNKSKLSVRERACYVALMAVGFLLIISASRDLLADGYEYNAAYSEYEQLRESYPVISSSISREQPTVTPAPIFPASPLVLDSELNIAHFDMHNVLPNSESVIPVPQETEAQDSLDGLADVNPDFVGWISIEGIIDYPIVRGRDNNRYLGVTYAGKRNGSGAIFMDYRNKMGFQDTVCIIYGHNMKNGSMFAPLNRYSDPAFLEKHPKVTIVTSDGEVLEYLIFAAKWISAWDKIYDLKYPDAATAAKAFGYTDDDASNFLLMSTCTPSADKTERMLVYAVQVTGEQRVVGSG